MELVGSAEVAHYRVEMVCSVEMLLLLSLMFGHSPARLCASTEQPLHLPQFWSSGGTVQPCLGRQRQSEPQTLSCRGTGRTLSRGLGNRCQSRGHHRCLLLRQRGSRGGGWSQRELFLREGRGGRVRRCCGRDTLASRFRFC